MGYPLPKQQLVIRILASTILGVRIARARKNLGWSAETLGHRSGLSASFIKRLELGAVAKPNLFEISAIAHAVGYTLDELTRTLPTNNAELALTLLRQRPELIEALTKHEVEYLERKEFC